ncbi:M48 family metallopeptidase [Castellaniella sp.]|uniref:M48 family metallopeptidase n=1 Tax=Castellaniella sp. TaxID=1955812 RepID=UPI002AFF8E81|nr:M48 family metallopeptidase [Castellaniella sp.]
MLTILFIACLLGDLCIRYWLAFRQIRHVQAHRDAVPAAFAEHIALRSHQRAADYTVARCQLTMIERVVEAAILLALTLMGGLQQMDLILGRLIDTELWRQLALVGWVLALLGIVGMAFTAWRTFRLEARFGFNRMTPRLFISDALKMLAVTLVLGTPLLAAILWLMDSAGPDWAWWAWGVWVVFNLLTLWLYPSFIAPLFNRFTPLDDPLLGQRIQQLAERCHFGLDGLYVMDGSRRSAHGNAYFTGFGRHRRIVFFDTLLARLNTDEVEAVLAHELGHFAHHHILRRITISFVTAGIFLQLLAWVSGQLWFYTDLGVLPQLGRPNDGLALVLFMLTLPVFTFWVAPLASLLSRRDEFQADRYAVQQCGAQPLISALVKLYDDNAATLTPDPIHSAWYDSHPPAAVRIAHLRNV